jgi:hypothetical protein
MKRSKFTEAQIAFVPKQAKDGAPVSEVSRDLDLWAYQKGVILDVSRSPCPAAVCS